MTTVYSDAPQAERQPPSTKVGPGQWLQKNLFDSWTNTALTVVSLAVLAWVLQAFVGWAFGDANWAVITNNLKIFASGTYPNSQIWRVWIVAAIAMGWLGVTAGTWRGVWAIYALLASGAMALVALTPLDPPVRLRLLAIAALTASLTGITWRLPQLRPWALLGWVLVIPIALELLIGSRTDLVTISIQRISGLVLTLLLAAIALIVAFPIGILLALGRTNGNLPVIQVFCTFLIELSRGVPLTTILFAAWLLVPLFLGGATVSLLIRASVGFIIFTAVLTAEDIRGGLQAIPRGQSEAARALGLNPFQLTLLITLPQALRTAVPALVGEFLTLFKDTSLVFIIGLTDLLGSARAVFTNPAWLGTQKETLFFVGVVYFVFCYAMSFAARRLEASLGLGKR